jgi:hypothetical protein
MKTKLVKTITSSVLFVCAFVSLVAVAMGFDTSGTARADSPAVSCSVQTLRGSYVFNPHGFNIVNGAAQPIAVFEGIDFNGDGTLTVPFATVSVNGLILHFPPGGTGTYTVNQDCQGTLTFTGGPINFDIFARANGKEIEMIRTDDNTVLNGTAKRVR